MLGQLNMDGLDKVQLAIKRIKAYEPPEGYFLAFSGGKDSVVCKALCDMAGVKYDAHYNVTSVDPPELVRFVKTFPDVHFDIPHDDDGKPVTMWNLIVKKKFPPLRMMRYCCQELKEGSGAGRFVITGVRWAESTRRSKTRAGLEYGSGQRALLDVDDPDNQEKVMFRFCPAKHKRVLNPIIDWGADDVWEFIHTYKVRYCSLYDEGFKRLGCIGCPMGDIKGMTRGFERWPQYKKLYIRAFERMIREREKAGLGVLKGGASAEECVECWIKGKVYIKGVQEDDET